MFQNSSDTLPVPRVTTFPERASRFMSSLRSSSVSGIYTLLSYILPTHYPAKFWTPSASKRERMSVARSVTLFGRPASRATWTP